MGTLTVTPPMIPLTWAEDFNSTPADWTFNGDAVVDSDSARLTLADKNQKGSAVSQTLTSSTTTYFDAEFDFRIGSNTGNGANGMSFALMDTATHGEAALFGEAPEHIVESGHHLHALLTIVVQSDPGCAVQDMFRVRHIRPGILQAKLGHDPVNGLPGLRLIHLPEPPLLVRGHA